MKKIFLAMAFLMAAPAFAADFGPELRPNRFFCYYRDSIGYSHGAGGTSLGQAKTRARRTCQEAERRRDDFATNGFCTFIGCRQVR